MGEDRVVQVADAAAPQIRRNDVFAHVDLRFARHALHAGKTPASTSMVFPSGKTRSRLSPWLTSMAVSSSIPRAELRFPGLPADRGEKSERAGESGRIAAAPVANADRQKPSRDAEKASEIQSGNAAMRQAGSKRTCQVATSSAQCKKKLASSRASVPAGRIDAKPERNNEERSGMTTMLADSPVTESRWK